MLHRNPNLRIAIVSYGLDLAQRFGRKIRDDLQPTPTSTSLLSPGHHGQHEFELLGYRGGVVCVGIGAASPAGPSTC
jgi:hypothetical protein